MKKLWINLTEDEHQELKEFSKESGYPMQLLGAIAIKAFIRKDLPIKDMVKVIEEDLKSIK